jgi:hypothetical protein
LESKTKKFHFQEIDWIVCFPSHGNEGKYCNYTVTFIDRKNSTPEGGEKIKLGELLDRPEIEKNYPHTVCFYKESSGNREKFRPEYLELRKIRTVEEFWMFLNALDI